MGDKDQKIIVAKQVQDWLLKKQKLMRREKFDVWVDEEMRKIKDQNLVDDKDRAKCRQQINELFLGIKPGDMELMKTDKSSADYADEMEWNRKYLQIVGMQTPNYIPYINHDLD